MSAPDFAAAQERILARRRLASRPQLPVAAVSAPPSLPPAFLNLPPALRTLAAGAYTSWNSLSTRASSLATANAAPAPYFRVGQVDAELLDEELLALLRTQVSDALKYFRNGHVAEDWRAEIGAALRAVIWKLSIWDRGTSYGASLQGLKYVDARRGAAGGDSSAALTDATRGQKVAYGVLTVGGRYGWTKLEDWLLDKESGYEEAPGWVRKVSRVVGWAGATHEVAALVSFLVFLYNGKYRTLVDRLVRLRLTPATAHTSREVSFEYLNRQLVWHAFTEFLLFLLPLVGISRWRRLLSRAWRKVKSTFTRSKDDEEGNVGGELGFLPERTCAICYRDQNMVAGGSEADVLAQTGAMGGGGVIGSAQTDITNSYEAIPCGCVYCFVCLAQRIEAEEGEGWTCLRCGELVKECRPWNGDVIEEMREKTSRSTSDSRPGSRKSVVFRDDDNDAPGRKMSFVDPMPLDDEDQAQDEEQPMLEEGEETGDWNEGEEELEFTDELDYEEAE